MLRTNPASVYDGDYYKSHVQYPYGGLLYTCHKLFLLMPEPS